MDRPKGRHRRGIQSASVVFVCTLIIVVVATGLFASAAPAPGAASSSSRIVTSSTDDRLLGTGPISTFPASWDDICGDLVSGNETTVGTNFGPDSPLTGPNLTLSQVYSRIVNSSAFQTLAAGRSWVTLDWGTGSITGSQGGGTFVDAHFLFISEGIPDPYGFAQMEYYVASGEVAGGLVPDQTTLCAGKTGFDYGVRLSSGTSALGQPVAINFTLRNLSTANMTITASTSCLGNFTVLQGYFGPVVYDSAKHPVCAGPPLKVVLSPGQSYAQTVEWNQKDDNGAQVPPGNYMIFATEVGYLGQIFPVPVVEGLTIGNQTAG